MLVGSPCSQTLILIILILESYLLDPGTPGVTPGTGLYVSTDQHLPVDELRTRPEVWPQTQFFLFTLSLSTRGRQLKKFLVSGCFSRDVSTPKVSTVLRQIFVHFATFSSTFVAFPRPSCYMYNLNK